jgi:hypothetical protein
MFGTIAEYRLPPAQLALLAKLWGNGSGERRGVALGDSSVAFTRSTVTPCSTVSNLSYPGT